jgi:hypothetical protein
MTNTDTLFQVSIHTTVDYGNGHTEELPSGSFTAESFSAAIRRVDEYVTDQTNLVRWDPSARLLSVVGGENQTYIAWVAPSGARYSREVRVRPVTR